MSDFVAAREVLSFQWFPGVQSNHQLTTEPQKLTGGLQSARDNDSANAASHRQLSRIHRWRAHSRLVHQKPRLSEKLSFKHVHLERRLGRNHGTLTRGIRHSADNASRSPARRS